MLRDLYFKIGPSNTKSPTTLRPAVHLLLHDPEGYHQIAWKLSSSNSNTAPLWNHPPVQQQLVLANTLCIREFFNRLASLRRLSIAQQVHNQWCLSYPLPSPRLFKLAVWSLCLFQDWPCASIQPDPSGTCGYIKNYSHNTLRNVWISTYAFRFTQFQRFIDTVIRGLPFIYTYIDNIPVIPMKNMSNTWTCYFNVCENMVLLSTSGNVRSELHPLLFSDTSWDILRLSWIFHHLHLSVN